MIAKKITGFFLATTLLFSNLGFAVTIHFCDNELASISIANFTTHSKIEKDCCGIVEKKSNCCHNKVVKAQEKQDQIVSKKVDYKVEFFVINQNIFSEFVSNSPQNQVQKATISSCFPNAPPLYKLYSQYLFYS